MFLKRLHTLLIAFIIGGAVIFAAGVIRSVGFGNVVLNPGTVIMIAGLVIVALALGALSVYRLCVSEFNDLLDRYQESFRKRLEQDNALDEIDRTRAARYGREKHGKERTRG